MFRNLTKKRLTLLLVSLSLILTAGVGVTLALIIDSTEDVENVFEPSHVSCAVIENGSETEHYNGTANVDSKTNVQIKNTGDTDAFIRAAIVVTWKKADGTVYAQKPVPASGDNKNDYSMTLDLDNGWSLGADGYYYYSSSVAPGTQTNTLITSATQNSLGPVGTDGAQYYLSIEIVASAIQSTLADNAQGAWVAAKTSGSN